MENEKSTSDDQAIKRSVGAFLKSVRLKRGYSLGQVAKALDKSRSWVCDVEAGRRGGAHLTGHHISLWADYLNIPVVSIVERQKLSDQEDLSPAKYRHYYKILRNKRRSAVMLSAVNELQDVVLEANQSLTLDSARKLLTRVAKSVTKISTCLEYTS
jgi:transcriptional regulator with XRE-family HTH domain